MFALWESGDMSDQVRQPLPLRVPPSSGFPAFPNLYSLSTVRPVGGASSVSPRLAPSASLWTSCMGVAWKQLESAHWERAVHTLLYSFLEGSDVLLAGRPGWTCRAAAITRMPS